MEVLHKKRCEVGESGTQSVIYVPARDTGGVIGKSYKTPGEYFFNPRREVIEKITKTNGSVAQHLEADNALVNAALGHGWGYWTGFRGPGVPVPSREFQRAAERLFKSLDIA